MNRSYFVETLLATSCWRRERRSQLRLYEVVACLFLLVAPLAAKSWRVTDFQDNILVDRDGSAVVTERITLRFDGEWRFSTRVVDMEALPNTGG